MTLSFIRCLFLVISGLVGYYIGILVQQPVLGAQLGCLCGLVLILLESQLRRVSVRGLSSMVFGLLLGVFMAKLISDIMSLLPLGDFIHSVSRVILTVIFSYLGAIMALRGKDEFNVIIPYVRFRRQDLNEGTILLDTSAIIDGRIFDVYKANFLVGRLVVPRFVLQELQKLADSSEDLKRQRGRRGMELLGVMQSNPKVDIRIHEEEMLQEQSVDVKLVKLAKLIDAKICTTDFNLAQMASLEGIKALTIQDLVNAVKSVVFPEEELKVKLIKEGKENHQAVGYLEDGTMIVVNEARQRIGTEVEVIVSSVLQTQAGKMVFARLKN